MGLGEIRLGEMGLGEMGQNPFVIVLNIPLVLRRRTVFQTSVEIIFNSHLDVTGNYLYNVTVASEGIEKFTNNINISYVQF